MTPDDAMVLLLCLAAVAWCAVDYLHWRREAERVERSRRDAIALLRSLERL